MENLNADVCPVGGKTTWRGTLSFDYFIVVGFLALLGYNERTMRIPPKIPWTLLSKHVTDDSIITVILRLLCVFYGMHTWFCEEGWKLETFIGDGG